ncbi:MAG: protein-export chaperone SecB [Lachnospiraceae bacterium]|nr:protein-export chaperone SecB [Lachnospiraceae bacterium]
MDIRKMKSELEMTGLYFKHCSVEREPKITDEVLEMNLNRKVIKQEDGNYFVELEVRVENRDLKVLVIACAYFSFLSETGVCDDIINKNTVAIMFPFIRSQVTLLTSQPGMQPVILPPINTAKYIDE